MWSRTEVELNGTLYQRIGGNWYDASTYISAPSAISRKLDEHMRRTRKVIRPQDYAFAQSNKYTSFRHADAFPIVAHVIQMCCDEENDYVTHDVITKALLADLQGYRLARSAAIKLGKSAEWAASNIVAWFSKRFTEGATQYQDLFERARVDGRWAYRRRPQLSSAD